MRRLMQVVEPGKIEIAAVHYVECARFCGHDVQDVDVMHLAVADVNERWDAAPQIQQRVHLGGRFGRTKRRPFEQAQAKIDGRRIQRVDRVAQLNPDRYRCRACERGE